MRTLILLLICSAFVIGAILDARADRKGSGHVLLNAVIALALGIFVCWLLVYVIGIFDNWPYSWRR